MKVQDFEELVLGCCIRWSGSSLSDELVAIGDVFDPMSPRRKVHMAISDCLMEGVKPSLPNVMLQLGTDLDSVGGADYLSLLSMKPEQFGLYDIPVDAEWEKYTAIISAASIYRSLAPVHKDLNTIMSKLDEVAIDHYQDPHTLLAKIIDRIAAVSKGKTKELGYEHISVAMMEAKAYAEKIKRGDFTQVYINIGWPTFAKNLIPAPASYHVVGGLSSSGKTQLCLQWCLGAALNMKVKGIKGIIAIDEFEQSGQSMAIRMICLMAGLDSMRLDRGEFGGEEYERFARMADKLQELPIRFSDKRGLTRTQVSAKLKTLHNGPDGPVIMALNDYPELQGDKADNEEQRVATIARFYQGMAHDIGCAYVGIYQYPKMDNATMLAGYAKERHSSGIWQASDINGELYNPISMKRAAIPFKLPKGLREDRAYFFIKKYRNRSTGWMELEWYPEYTQFKDPAVADLREGVYDIDTSWIYDIDRVREPDF